MTTPKSRHILVVSHTAKPAAITATRQAIATLAAQQVTPVMTSKDAQEFQPHLNFKQIKILEKDIALAEVELALVLGGDGTILRAAEIVYNSNCPIVGVNLGHVGFLAEMEPQDLDTVLNQLLTQKLEVEERHTLTVQLFDGDTLQHETFAVNEATIEKTSRMIELNIGIDGRALTGFGGDGVVVATATGSTAYAFSAGGPIMWPSVAGMLVVPLAAHALFNRPLVLGQQQRVEIQLSERSGLDAALWCDGRRRYEAKPGRRIVITQSDKKLRLARLHAGHFTERLVNKFNLPVTGWREAAAQ